MGILPVTYFKEKQGRILSVLQTWMSWPLSIFLLEASSNRPLRTCSEISQLCTSQEMDVFVIFCESLASSIKFLNSYAICLGHEVFVSLISSSCLIQRLVNY